MASFGRSTGKNSENEASDNLILTPSCVRKIFQIVGRMKIRAPKAKRTRLAYDMCCVLSGLRTCSMVDYLHVFPAALSELIQAVTQAIPTIKGRMEVMEMAGCCYLLNAILFHRLFPFPFLAPSPTASPALNEQSLVSLPRKPRFVALGKGPIPRWISEEEEEEADALRAIQSFLASLLEERRPMSRSLPLPLGSSSPPSASLTLIEEDAGRRRTREEDCRAGLAPHPSEWQTKRWRGRGRANESQGANTTWCGDRALETSKLPLPTLNGWLLGYPVVYLIQEKTTVACEQAAELLSSTPLVLFHVFLPLADDFSRFVRGTDPEGGRGKHDGEEGLLMSFTVPRDLLEDEVEKDEFVGKVRSSVLALKRGDVWMEPQVSVSTESILLRRIAL